MYFPISLDISWESIIRGTEMIILHDSVPSPPARLVQADKERIIEMHNRA